MSLVIKNGFLLGVDGIIPISDLSGENATTAQALCQRALMQKWVSYFLPENFDRLPRKVVIGHAGRAVRLSDSPLGPPFIHLPREPVQHPPPMMNMQLNRIFLIMRGIPEEIYPIEQEDT